VATATLPSSGSRWIRNKGCLLGLPLLEVRLPLPRESLCLGKLVGRELPPRAVANLRIKSLFLAVDARGREAESLVRLHVVGSSPASGNPASCATWAPHRGSHRACAVGVQHAEPVLRLGFTLVGRFAKPRQGIRFVIRNAAPPWRTSRQGQSEITESARHGAFSHQGPPRDKDVSSRCIRRNIEQLIFQCAVLVGSRTDLDGGRQPERTFGMKHRVDASDSLQDDIEVSLYVGAIRMQLHLEARFADDLVSPADLVANRDTDPDGNNLNLSQGFHASLLTGRAAP